MVRGQGGDTNIGGRKCIIYVEESNMGKIVEFLYKEDNTNVKHLQAEDMI
jgi:hypothetical protein